MGAGRFKGNQGEEYEKNNWNNYIISNVTINFC